MAIGGQEAVFPHRIPLDSDNLSIHDNFHFPRGFLKNKLETQERVTSRVATKSRLEQLRGNVKTEESKLEKGMRQLDQAKKRKTRGGVGDLGSDWDALERTVNTMEGLLTQYRRYSAELEKQNAKLSSVSMTLTAKLKKSKEKKKR